MSWDIGAVVTEIANIVRESPTLIRVYSARSFGDDRIPPAINEFPAAIVYPESSYPVTAAAGQIRTTAVNIDVFTGRWDIGFSAASSLLAIEEIIRALHANVVLTPSARWTQYNVMWLLPLDWGGIVYAGGRINVELIEDQQAVLMP